MSFAILWIFYILISLAESSNSPLIAFLVLKFALPCKLSPPSTLNVICRHRKQTGIRFIDFFLLFSERFSFLTILAS